MKTVRDILKGDIIVLHPSGAETADGNSVDFYIGHAKSGVFVLDVTAYSGFTGVAIKIQNKDPISGKLDDAITFTNVTGVGTQWKYALDSGKQLGNLVRLFWDVTGTGSITFSASGMLKHN